MLYCITIIYIYIHVDYMIDITVYVYIAIIYYICHILYVISIQIALYTSYPGRGPESRAAPQRNATLARQTLHPPEMSGDVWRRIVDCKPLASWGGVLQGLTRMDLNIKEPSFFMWYSWYSEYVWICLEMGDLHGFTLHLWQVWTTRTIVVLREFGLSSFQTLTIPELH